MFKSLINLFFPKTCSGCNNNLTANETIICTICRHDIPLTNHYLNPENEAFKKFYGRVAVRHVSCFVYFHKAENLSGLFKLAEKSAVTQTN